MAKPKRFSTIQPKDNPGGMPDGSYDGAITNAEIGATFGRMASLWSHIEDAMIDVLTELLGGNADLPSRQIFRSIVSSQARIKVMRSLLQRVELNDTKDTIYDEVINEFAALNDLRNTFLHGLWYTHESGRVYFVEESIDDLSVFHAREVTAQEIEALIHRMTALEDRVAALVDGEYDIRQAYSS
jgi:hypothetical protein